MAEGFTGKSALTLVILSGSESAGDVPASSAD
jgi:hypothetical protein